tara:strand:+ start:360 stop:560 length:201 start_codon:yes stop_codon:yes gene_type:complete
MTPREKLEQLQKQVNRLEQLDKSQLEKILLNLLKQPFHKNATAELIQEEYNFALGEATLKFIGRNK